MGGEKQLTLERVIELLERLGRESPKKAENETLFQELTGYSWKWTGEGWATTLRQIKTRYENESKRVRKIQTRRFR